MAEKLRKDRPGKKLMLIAYSPTRRPPQTFHEFPENVMIELADSSPESFDAWRKIKVPQGFSVYLYNWGQYNPGGLTPKTSPAFCAEQVRFFMRNQVKGIYRCGFGELFGLEGPAYYVFGKIFDDPEKSAKELLADYCRNAFREAAFPMHVFYENLYQRLDMIPHPDYRNSEAFVSRPMTLLPLLYSWDLLATMGKNLAEAEAKAIGPKVKKRLELVRLEFNYLNNLASVIHLYNAYKISPSQALFEPLARKIERTQFHDRLPLCAGRLPSVPSPAGRRSVLSAETPECGSRPTGGCGQFFTLLSHGTSPVSGQIKSCPVSEINH